MMFNHDDGIKYLKTAFKREMKLSQKFKGAYIFDASKIWPITDICLENLVQMRGEGPDRGKVESVDIVYESPTKCGTGQEDKYSPNS